MWAVVSVFGARGVIPEVMSLSHLHNQTAVNLASGASTPGKCCWGDIPPSVDRRAGPASDG